MVGSDWLKSKNRRKNKEKRDKNNFFQLYFPHSPVFYLTAKFKHCSVRQSKVRAEDVQHARELVVNQSWMRYLRCEEICLLPKELSSISSLKSTYFPLSIVYCFYSMYFIIGVIVKFLLQQRLQLSSTCRRVAMWTSRTEAVVYVVRRRSL